MSDERTSTRRLEAFSDSVIAVIITIMVLELKAPAKASFDALIPLWPTVLSYAVSYLFIAIIWVNHSHLLRFVRYASPRLTWLNFAHLFVVSLLSFVTTWVARTYLSSSAVTVYGGVFVIVSTFYLIFERESLAQADTALMPAYIKDRILRRSLIGMGLFMAATILASFMPYVGFGLICCSLGLYLRPESFRHKIKKISD